MYNLKSLKPIYVCACMSLPLILCAIGLGLCLEFRNFISVPLVIWVAVGENRKRRLKLVGGAISRF